MSESVRKNNQKSDFSPLHPFLPPSLSPPPIHSFSLSHSRPFLSFYTVPNPSPHSLMATSSLSRSVSASG
jgi:hypothetical protein